MIDEKHKLREFTYENTLELVKEEMPEFLAEYIYKINKTYNLLIDKIIELQSQNKFLRGNIKRYSKKANNRYRALKDQEKYIAKLNRETQRYFDFGMDILNEKNGIEEKYNKALEIMANYSPPCEKDGFMDKNTDYCSMNCGVDEEVFKSCWDLYIEQELENDRD